MASIIGAVACSHTPTIGFAEPEAARALLDFICSPAADEARRRHGMQPA